MAANDQELLRRYSREGAEEAFTELVHRYADLVWSAGFRVTHNAALAEEVVQSVFADLARKARWLPESVILAGWLYRAACLAGSKALRAETRRLRREKQAMDLHSASSEDAQRKQETERLMPLLDEALGALGENDRNAIVLRFFARKNLAEVGAALGISDDAAQKRLSRALEKLRRVFQSKGVAASAGGLAAALGATGAQAAPAGLAGTVALASVSLASSTAGTGIWAALSAIPSQIAIMKTNLAIGAVALAVVGTPLVIQNQALTQQRAEKQALAAETADLDDLRQRHAQWLAQAAAAEELERLRAEAEELRARGADKKLALQQTHLAARTALEAAREQADFEEARIVFEEAQEQVVNVMKQLGVAQRIWASDNSDRLPPSTLVLTNELGAAFPIASEQFELVEHARPLEPTDNDLILFREKTPRRHPGGSWYRIYGKVDGSVWTKHFADPQQFEEWEAQFKAQSETPEPIRPISPELIR